MTSRTVPVTERMTMEWVSQPPGYFRTPFTMAPSVTPVAAKITSPEARSSRL